MDMKKPSTQPIHTLFREIPPVHELLELLNNNSDFLPLLASLKTQVIREVLDELRKKMDTVDISNLTQDKILIDITERLRDLIRPSIIPVINLSGTLLHTNLGRALLPQSISNSIVETAVHNVNLEYHLDSGKRGDRDEHIATLLHYLTGAEESTVVNNNAAAVLLTLNSLANHKEVIVSRGELIEIGGSFRLPEVMKKSGCKLIEVGSTNRTHPSDYENAITNKTALILKAHPSNYRIQGFTSEVSLYELSVIGKNHQIPVMMDMGSGALADFSQWGLPREQTVRETLEAGADIVTFSGDKLLGGPQAGVIVGKVEYLKKIRKNPLKRAMRPDKLTYEFLESLLKLYLYPDRMKEEIPLFKWLARPLNEIDKTALLVKDEFQKSKKFPWKITVEDSVSEIGSGSLPGAQIPTRVIAITPVQGSVDKIARTFREQHPPVIGRIHEGRFILDMRTLYDPQVLFSILRD